MHSPRGWNCGIILCCEARDQSWTSRGHWYSMMFSFFLGQAEAWGASGADRTRVPWLGAGCTCANKYPRKRGTPVTPRGILSLSHLMPVMRPPSTDWCCDTHKAKPVDIIRNDSSLLPSPLHQGFCVWVYIGRGDFIFANPQNQHGNPANIRPKWGFYITLCEIPKGNVRLWGEVEASLCSQGCLKNGIDFLCWRFLMLRSSSIYFHLRGSHAYAVIVIWWINQGSMATTS